MQPGNGILRYTFQLQMVAQTPSLQAFTIVRSINKTFETTLVNILKTSEGNGSTFVAIGTHELHSTYPT